MAALLRQRLCTTNPTSSWSSVTTSTLLGRPPVAKKSISTGRPFICRKARNSARGMRICPERALDTRSLPCRIHSSTVTWFT